MGLGFVLSFGYWCTDFLVVQRAMAADSMTAARRTPLIAAVPKMLFPFLVILPGMIALGAAGTMRRHAVRRGQSGPGGAAAQRWHRPPKMDSGQLLDGHDGRVVLDYDLATPMMLVQLLPRRDARPRAHRAAGLLHVGHGGQRDRVQHRVDLRHLPELHHGAARDAHYLWMGRVGHRRSGILLSVAAAYVAGAFNNIMDLLQLVFAFVNAPLFATFVLGHVLEARHRARRVRRAAVGHAGRGACTTASRCRPARPSASRAATSAVLHTYPERDGAELLDRHRRVDHLLRRHDRREPGDPRRGPRRAEGLVYSLTPRPRDEGVPLYRQPGPLAVVVLLATIVLNIIFW